MRRLTPSLRVKLKSPLGILIRGSSYETMRELKKMVNSESPSRIISVGDMVSGNMISNNILPHVLVVDNKIMREPIKPIFMEVDQTIRVRNPPGTLTDETWVAMQEAMEHAQRTRILVDGEEDLITLVAVLCAPEGSFVVYGQPREGVVVVKVTNKKKESMHRIVEEMEEVKEK